MKLTNPPLVCCRECGAVFVHSFVLSHTIDKIGLWKPTDLPEIMEKVQAAPSGDETYYLGSECPARTMRGCEGEYETRACGCEYWRFVEVL